MMTRTSDPAAAPNEPETYTGRVPLLTTDHQGLDVLSSEECAELVAGEEIGRVGFNQRGQTIILPVNYAFIAGSVLFRTAPGSKLDIALIGGPTSFEVDAWDAETRSGWSVLIKGRSAEVTDEWVVSLAEHFGVEPWADQIPRDHWVRISVDEISGRWIYRDEGDSPRPGLHQR